jgi:uncharacterized membrane protein
MAKKDDSDTKLFAFLGVFLTLIGFIIVLLTKKEDKYAMYYAKQGLILFIAWVIAWVVMMIFAFVPVLGWIIDVLLWILLVVLWVIGIIYSLSGEQKPIPVIGALAEKIKL